MLNDCTTWPVTSSMVVLPASAMPLSSKLPARLSVPPPIRYVSVTAPVPVSVSSSDAARVLMVAVLLVKKAPA